MAIFSPTNWLGLTLLGLMVLLATAMSTEVGSDVPKSALTSMAGLCSDEAAPLPPSVVDDSGGVNVVGMVDAVTGVVDAVDDAAVDTVDGALGGVPMNPSHVSSMPS